MKISKVLIYSGAIGAIIATGVIAITRAIIDRTQGA